MSRRYDPRRARSHRTYNAEEISELLRVGVGTVHKWRRKEGLQPIDDKRPYLFDGRELARFLSAKNKPIRSLLPNHFLCAPCKAHRQPKANCARVTPKSQTSVTLIGECPVCSRIMHRPMRRVELSTKAGNLHLHYEEGTAPLSEAGDAPHTDTSEGIEP